LVSTSWTTISGFSTSIISGMTAGGSGLTVTQAENYLVQVSLSLTGGSTGLWEIGISINGAAPAVVSRRTMSTGSDVGNVKLSCLLSLSVSDVIAVVAKAPSSSSATPVNAQLVAVNIEDISRFDSYALLSVGSTTSTTIGASTFSTLNGFTTSETSSGWTASSGQLSADASAAGTYLAIFTMSYTGSNNTVFDGGITLGSGPYAAMLCRRKLSSNADIGNMSAAAILTVSSGTTVTPMARNNEVSSKTCTLEHATLVLVKIDGSGASSEATSHASMAVTSGLSQGLLSTNSQITASGFSNQLTDVGRWSYSSNRLSPIGVTAGTYLVTYYTSFSSSAPSSIDFAVQKGGSDVAVLTTQRSTSSGGISDNGAVGGCGILTVSAASDVISFSLVDRGSSSPELTVNSAFVSLTRIMESSPIALPVELTSFTAHIIDQHVDLRWRTETELQNYGFDVERSTDLSFWDLIGFVPGSGNSATPRNYHFTDASLPTAEKIHYRLRQRDKDGTEVLSSTVMVDLSRTELALNLAAFPHPMHSSAVLHLTLPALSRVRLALYDLAGREQILLLDGEELHGRHAVTLSAEHLPAGLYVARLQTPTGSKSLLIRKI